MQSKLLMVAAIAVAAWSMPVHATTHKEAPEMKADCEKQATEKKLAGAARNSFVKKCAGGGAMEASPACKTQAADKKLHGAAEKSFLKKCMADAKA